MIAPASEPVAPHATDARPDARPGAEDVAAWRRAVAGSRVRESWSGRLPPAEDRLGFRVVVDVGCMGDADALAAFVDSLRAQILPEWSLVFVRRADASPPDAEMADVIAHYARIDGRVSGAVLALMGPQVHKALDPEAAPLTLLVDRPGRLEPAALAALAERFAATPTTALVYADETAEDEASGPARAHQMLCKQPWDAHLALTRDLFGALKAIRSPLAVNACVDRESGTGPAWFYAHALRAAEMLRTDQIRHVAEPLFRRAGDPFPDVARDAGERAAVQEALIRRRRAAQVVAVATGLRRVVPTPTVWPAVSVIIPTKDKVDFLRRIVTGLLDDTDYPALDITIIDNRSEEPETLAYLEAIDAHGDVRILRIDEPFNFARLNNLAAARAQGDVLLFLNNDTEVVHPDWLREMVAHALRPEVGAVGALLSYPDGRIQHAGVMMGADQGLVGHLGVLMDDTWIADGPGATERPVSAVTAACLAIRADVYRAMGGFDEAFTVAYNDVDLCLRLRRAGYAVVWTPGARLVHHESVSRTDDRRSGNRDRAMVEERGLIARWGVTLQDDPLQPPAFELATPGWVRGAVPRCPHPWLAAR
ncbi:glycosyltransferase family 2 protein [uncultured Rhodospira sp.]|uniref:glycosyltransferase family 2 protein n=1 Tax=uncultured Rhodospira sp. TaxID=1936189 RepID=UPI00261BE144|nr:glycosyltransferase family 2 protein [uncultured Rhodospira sp.]